MDPVGLVSDEQRSIISDFLARDLEEIEEKLPSDASGTSPFSIPSYIHVFFSSCTYVHGTFMLIVQSSPSYIFERLVCTFGYPHFSILQIRPIIIPISCPSGKQLLRFFNVYLIWTILLVAYFHTQAIISCK